MDAFFNPVSRKEDDQVGFLIISQPPHLNIMATRRVFGGCEKTKKGPLVYTPWSRNESFLESTHSCVINLCSVAPGSKSQNNYGQYFGCPVAFADQFRLRNRIIYIKTHVFIPAPCLNQCIKGVGGENACTLVQTKSRSCSSLLV